MTLMKTNHVTPPCNESDTETERDTMRAFRSVPKVKEKERVPVRIVVESNNERVIDESSTQHIHRCSNA